MALDNEIEDFLNRSLTIVEEFEKGHDVSRKIESLTLPETIDADILEVYRVVRNTCSKPPSPNTDLLITTPKLRSRAIRIPKLDINQLNNSLTELEHSIPPTICCHPSSHMTKSIVSKADFLYLTIFIIFISAIVFIMYPPHRYCGPV